MLITQPDSIPDDLRRFEAKIDGPLWLHVIDALPKTLAEPLAASVKSSEPSNSAIKQHIANGGVVEGAWSNAGTICESNSGRLNQTLAGSIGRRWRWLMPLFEESPILPNRDAHVRNSEDNR